MSIPIMIKHAKAAEEEMEELIHKLSKDGFTNLELFTSLIMLSYGVGRIARKGGVSQEALDHINKSAKEAVESESK